MLGSVRSVNFGNCVAVEVSEGHLDDVCVLRAAVIQRANRGDDRSRVALHDSNGAAFVAHREDRRWQHTEGKLSG